MVDTPPRPAPRITRALVPRTGTALQRRLADRDLVIYSAHHFGCSIRLIAAAFGIDPAIVRDTIERFESGEENSSPEDSPKSVRTEEMDESTGEE